MEIYLSLASNNYCESVKCPKCGKPIKRFESFKKKGKRYYMAVHEDGTRHYIGTKEKLDELLGGTGVKALEFLRRATDYVYGVDDLNDLVALLSEVKRVIEAISTKLAELGLEDSPTYLIQAVVTINDTLAQISIEQKGK